VVKVLDLQLETAGSIPAAALSSATVEKLLFIHMVSVTKQYNRYRRKLGSKQAHHAKH